MSKHIPGFELKDMHIYLIFFVCGIFAGIIFFRMKTDLIYPAMSLFQELRTDKLKRDNIVLADLFGYVLVGRFREFGILFLTQITFIRRVTAYICSGFAGFACAVLESFYVHKYGVKGMLIFGATLIPHYIFYFMAWYSICTVKFPVKVISKAEIPHLLKVITTATAILFVGIIGESTINIWILKIFF